MKMRYTKLFPSVRFLYRRLNYGKVVTRKYSAESGCGGAEKKGVVICVYENNTKLELTPIGAQVDEKCGGKISQQLNMLSCELKLGKAFAITDIMEYSVVAITSIGPKGAGYNFLESLDEARENIRWGVGAGVKLLKERGCIAIEVDPVTAPDAAAEAAELAAWTFEVFKSPGASKPPCQVSVYGGEGSALWCEGSIRGRAQNWARWMSDMPANKMTPVDLAQAALDGLCHLGVVVEAHDREWIEAQRMRAFLAVARGSCDTPMFLECAYRGAGANVPPVLLAAKGVTFDSGGLCLKDCPAMIENRGSMAGAAVVLAAFKIIAKLKLPINVAGVVPICENMVSGQCMKVGDVVHALNGLSIQIENTDMEGRLLLADALVYGQSIYKPSLVIDVATFTHGVLMATGGGAFGCFSNSDAAWHAVRCAGASSGDRPWRFPLWQYFHNQLTNDPSVDLRNRGCGHATPCLGAAFLKNFVCSDWVHMDITGVGKVAHAGAPPYLDTCRMTGRPARTIAVLLQHIAVASSTHGSQPCAPSPQTSLPSPQCSQPPELSTCAPEPPICARQPPTCAPQPPTCAPQPPTCAPQPPTCAPRPPTCAPKPPTNAPKPPTYAPRPPSCAPQPPTCEPQPPTCAPQPPTCAPQPPTCAPQPPTCAPQPPTCAPRPPTCAPKPPTNAPKPPTYAPRPPSCAPQPPTCEPQPPTCAPQPPTCAPQPPTCAPQPPTCAPQPPTCAPQPPTCAPQPPTCAPQPPNCAPQPPTCAPQPPTCAPKPPTCAPRPPTCAPQPPTCAPQPPTCARQPPTCAPQPPTCASQLPNCAAQPPTCAPKPSTCATKHLKFKPWL